MDPSGLGPQHAGLNIHCICNMITTRSGSFSIKESVIAVALSLVAALCVSPYSGYLPDGQITFKWIGAGIAFCATVIIEILFSCTGTGNRTGLGGDIVDIRTIAIPFLVAFLIVTIHSLLQVTRAVPVNSHNGYLVMAGFDNPAGAASAMAVSFPFVLALADRLKDRRIRYAVMCGAFCVIIMILAVARSRVGILASGVVMVLWVIHTNNNVRAGRIVASILAVLVIAAVVYMSFHKRGSNSGRALILGVCWDMFKDAPLFGHGLHGFRSQYMLYQADYLERSTSLVLPMLADNTTHPLNEYALLAVNSGLAGIVVLLSGVILTIMHYLKNPGKESLVGMMVLAGIGVLSLFSYPFRYPSTILGLLSALMLVYKDVLLRLTRTTIIVLRSITTTVSVLGLFLIITWTGYQIQWGKLSEFSNNGKDTNAVIEGYNSLYPKLKYDPYFLFNYSYILSETGDYRKAGNMATESFDLMANYDTALLIADNAKECGNIDTAEKYYWLASRMCPVRFIPLYALFCLFEDTGRQADMKMVGERILSKCIKVHSTEVRQIISDVQMKLLINT